MLVSPGRGQVRWFGCLPARTTGFPQNAFAPLVCLFLRCFAPFSVADGFGCWLRWSWTSDRHSFFGPEARTSHIPFARMRAR